MIIADILSDSYHLMTDQKTADQPFHEVYATDLLSQAIHSADPGNGLITIISHENTVALAMMIDLPLIIIAEGKCISDQMIQKGNEENICLISTPLKTHEVILDLYQRGFL